MTPAELLRAIQSRAARIAVGASTVRGRGNAGTVKAARDYFVDLDLAGFAVTPKEFPQALDRHTHKLLASLPKPARHWGIARKLLNIFLRDCLYTGALNTAYKLSRAEEAYELPLDSITAKNLIAKYSRGELPRWPGVKHLSPELSAEYQEAALELARRMKVSRVHLDAVWWAQGRDG
jgi:hypothetical protein